MRFSKWSVQWPQDAGGFEQQTQSKCKQQYTNIANSPTFVAAREIKGWEACAPFISAITLISIKRRGSKRRSIASRRANKSSERFLRDTCVCVCKSNYCGDVGKRQMPHRLHTLQVHWSERALVRFQYQLNGGGSQGNVPEKTEHHSGAIIGVRRAFEWK